MPHGTSEEWLFDNWKLIVTALRDAKHEDCRCYECDTADSLLEDIAHYWDLNEGELLEVTG